VSLVSNVTVLPCQTNSSRVKLFRQPNIYETFGLRGNVLLISGHLTPF